MLCSDHLKQPFVHLFFPCGLIVYYAVRADSEFFTCLSRKKSCEYLYEKHSLCKITSSSFENVSLCLYGNFEDGGVNNLLVGSLEVARIMATVLQFQGL